ncbi:type IV toxin-antitoxin system AbiEi family antitoxin [Xenorhabdus stockiae]|uniref:type IV toxin-antitoxin system AbiEi family antitoxin n=1 Tax=Xenorhabdus stockiae TaxID=351614 RepID=UPI003CF1D8C5
MSSKINWLVNHTVPGALILQQWLIENGISYSLTQKYTQNGWLKKLFTGVYYRPNSRQDYKPEWADALKAVIDQLHLPVHLAGLTSLTYQGLSHYLPLKSEQVWVGVGSKQSLPKWFKEFPDQRWLYCSNNKLSELSDTDFTFVQVNGRELKASSPELAAYELIDSIGKNISFEHAAELFQGLVNLSPRKVQSLLLRSHAVQTNRIFLFLSHYYDHQWVKRLEESQIELGSGKRQVVAQGRYDERYKITVPATFDV